MSMEQAVAELQTIRDFIRWGVSRFNEAGIFFGHGTDNALDESAYLVLFALNLPPQVGEPYLDTRLTTNERHTVVKLLNRRIEERLPAPYLTHEALYGGLPLYVDERVLIPRSPIVELVEAHFAPWVREPDLVMNILDLCTGSGCIALICAAAFPGAHVDASDLSTDALEVAKINVERFEAQDQVSLIQSDLFRDIPPKRYDIIVSNPPYVDELDMSNLPHEYRHEPKQALEAGRDGLDLVFDILYHAMYFLEPRGILVVEVGNSREALEKLLPEVEFLWLEFERGGEGVFLLTAEQVNKHHELIRLVRPEAITIR
jgi:ribosomal protein L3 glutamine methyltransferase